MTIYDHAEFKEFLDKVKKSYEGWKTKNLPLLNGMKVGTKPKEIISIISEDILERFSKLELVNILRHAIKSGCVVVTVDGDFVSRLRAKKIDVMVIEKEDKARIINEKLHKRFG